MNCVLGVMHRLEVKRSSGQVKIIETIQIVQVPIDVILHFELVGSCA